MRQQGAGVTPDAIAGTVAATLLVVAMGFGGGSRGAGDAVVHLFAVPALWLGIVRWRHRDATRLQRAFLGLFLAAIGLAVLQLIPLPVSWVGALPLRAGVFADLAVAGIAPNWLPMSLDPWATVRALLALTTALAMWLLCGTLPTRYVDRLLAFAAVLAVPMVLLGFAQVSAGAAADLHVHDFQNKGSATGLFANRNHLAALLAMLAPLAMVLGYRAQQQRRTPAALGWYGALVLLLLGAAMTFSRAGILLASLATAVTGAGLVIRNRDTAATWPRRHAGLFVALLLAVLAIGNYAWGHIIDRFEADPLGDRRWEYLQHGWDAIKAFLPWGSGLGSFRDVYAPFEPVTAMVNTHALHAHNDLVEVALEAGLPGLLLVAGLLVVVVACVRKGLTAPRNAGLLPMAAAIAVIVPVAHSVVDYPLRTLAVTVVFALLLAGLSGLSVAASSKNTNGHTNALT